MWQKFEKYQGLTNKCRKNVSNLHHFIFGVLYEKLSDSESQYWHQNALRLENTELFTTWSPACTTVQMAVVMAAMPLLKVRLPAPPSSCCTRHSASSQVGFPVRRYMWPPCRNTPVQICCWSDLMTRKIAISTLVLAPISWPKRSLCNLCNLLWKLWEAGLPLNCQ